MPLGGNSWLSQFMRLRRNSSKRSVDEVCQQTFLLGVAALVAIACARFAAVFGLALAAVFGARFAAILGVRFLFCLHTYLLLAA